MEIEKKNAQRTRAIILEAAANIIREKGLQALKISRLADRSNFTRWTIYNHFGNLDGIKKELYSRHDYLIANLPKIVSLAARQEGAIKLELLAHLIVQHFDTIMRDSLYREFAVAEFMGTDAAIAKMVSTREQRMLKMMKASGLIESTGKPFPLDFLFPIILGGITYMAFQYRIGGHASCFGVRCLQKEFKTNLRKFLIYLIKTAISSLDGDVNDQQMA
ncbi:TetR/AcrR family transcriptional regulator [Olivibacter jilunii]|uniref:TetR/AcrR family transcriptional regulator n=1 Tax=Olivibacter jilunii TaxID=985016 RepID=UPI003F1802ED